MTESKFNYIKAENHSPIKAWTKGVPVEDKAMQQVIDIAKLPFIYKHVAIMPDVHWGMGATIGSVIATKGAIVPAAVGVDIGCGMMAMRTTLTSNDLPDNLHNLRSKIEEVVPHGRSNNGQFGDKGAFSDLSNGADIVWNSLHSRYLKILAKHPKIEPRQNPALHLGTLGTGNHFIEVCLDQDGFVWVMLHSGSRGIGNKIGTYFIEKAKEEMHKWHIDSFLPNNDLSYLVENTELFDDYVEAVSWAQDFAMANRALMMEATLKAMREVIDVPFSVGDEAGVAVNCHHNYVDRENHFGENVIVTRKGAVRARSTDLGIIPGSMGAKSFIVRGKGNKDSFCSCSHGAGRVMGREQAKKTFSLSDHEQSTIGVECRKDIDVIDETPKAYKNIDDVMNAQSDLVDIVYTLKQVLCVKG